MNQQETEQIIEFTTGQNLFYFFAMLISLAALAASVVFLLRKIRSRSSSDAGKPFQFFTLLMLLVIIIIFIPVYYLSYSFDDSRAYLRPLLLAVHNAMRVFILDGEFDFIKNNIRGMDPALHVWFSRYAVLLYVVAPVIFTFTIFLSIFRDFYTELRLYFGRKAVLYVFSCLNENSAAMAQSILKAYDDNVAERENDREQLKGKTIGKIRKAIRKAWKWIKKTIRKKWNWIKEKIRKNKDKNKIAEKKQDKCMIVFCRVPGDEEQRETLTALVPDISNKRSSILLTGKNADQINVSRFNNENTFFLMDKDEEKNLQDASNLSGQLIKQFDMQKDKESKKKESKKKGSEKKGSEKKESEKKHAVRILVYASTASSVPLTDAMSRPIFVPDDTVNKLKNVIDDACKADNDGETNQIQILDKIQNYMREGSISVSEPFSIMRIDTKKQMAMWTIHDLIKSGTLNVSEGESLTVTLLGMGGTGKAILENLLWMCQVYGRRLTINVFDAAGPELGETPDNAGNPLYDQLSTEWPELMGTNYQWQKYPQTHRDTEADYDVRFFLGMDCFSSRFRRLFEEDSADRRRLLKSDLIVCSMGDDDRNVDAAIMMRQLFVGEGVKEGQNNKEGQLCLRPAICAVVYDNQQSACISSQGQITNYKGTAYNIKTIGSMQDQYSFDKIKRLEENEKEAIAYHVSWCCTKTETEPNQWINMSDAEKISCLKKELKNYVHFEYFRQSSLSKALHKNLLKDQRDQKKQKDEGDQKDQNDQQVKLRNEALLRDKEKHDYNDPACRCALCRSRITEHMRWNTYMRINGYRYGKTRDDMAKFHTCLLPWNELPLNERVKD